VRGAAWARLRVLLLARPGQAEELAEAQRLGGMRRKRERTIAAAYDFTGLGSIEAIRRISRLPRLTP
jgi:hypothetical protein